MTDAAQTQELQISAVFCNFAFKISIMEARGQEIYNKPDISRHIINQNAPLTEALRSLNALSGGIMTLFVVDSDMKMVGTLTDGDVRRGLIAGLPLHTEVHNVMYREFRYLSSDTDNFHYLRKLKKSRIHLIPILDSEHRIIDVLDLQSTANMIPIDAVLMAGGRGERLRPMTIDTPKPLLQIGGKAIIDYNVDELIRNGVDNIFVTVNYLHEQIESHFSIPRRGTKIECVLEPKRLGTLGSVALIDGLRHDHVLVMNSDLLTTLSYEEMYAWHIDHDADLTMAVIPYTVSIPFAIVDHDADCVKGLIEKPTHNYLANAGIYIIRRRMLSNIKCGEYLDAPDFIERLIADGRKVCHYRINGTWIDIGSPDDFRYANELMNRPDFR